MASGPSSTRSSATQTGRGVDVELVGQAQDLALAEVQEHLRLARVLAQQALEAAEQVLAQARWATP